VKYVSSAANYGSYNPKQEYGHYRKYFSVWFNCPTGYNTVVVEKLGSIENHAHVHTDSYDPILSGHNASASIYVRDNHNPEKFNRNAKYRCTFTFTGIGFIPCFNWSFNGLY
jgi:hypothetical protein